MIGKTFCYDQYLLPQVKKNIRLLVQIFRREALAWVFEKPARKVRVTQWQCWSVHFQSLTAVWIAPPCGRIVRGSWRRRSSVLICDVGMIGARIYVVSNATMGKSPQQICDRSEASARASPNKSEHRIPL
jgi:hypothetical protein